MMLDGGRRMGVERRIYGYDAYFPERRDGIERRTGEDRRKSDLGRTVGLKRRLSDQV